jgi:hypothetical protein
VANLDEKYLWSPTCKEMLLKPKNSMGNYCKKMKLNIDDTGAFQSFFRCENNDCKIENRVCVSLFGNLKCICGKLLNQETSLNLNEENGFVRETSTFIVSDDLYVMPNIVRKSLNLLQKHGVNDTGAIHKQIVNKLLLGLSLSFLDEDCEHFKEYEMPLWKFF